MQTLEQLTPLLTLDRVSDFAHGLDHTEGVAWGLDGYVYAGGESGQLYRIDPAKPEAKLVTSTGGFLLGLALDAGNNVYACDAKHAVVQKITPGGASPLIVKAHRASRSFSPPITRPSMRRATSMWPIQANGNLTTGKSSKSIQMAKLRSGVELFQSSQTASA